MFRGYRCVNKRAVDILAILGFTSSKTRGYYIDRTSQLAANKPVRLHALVHLDTDGTEYIDVHEDYEVDGQHKSKRRHRVRRLNQFFYEVDNDLPLTIGHKMRRHYLALRQAADDYERHSKS